jgi:hypothetical protein
MSTIESSMIFTFNSSATRHFSFCIAKGGTTTADIGVGPVRVYAQAM